jgi:rubrerythrin
MQKLAQGLPSWTAPAEEETFDMLLEKLGKFCPICGNAPLTDVCPACGRKGNGH